MTGENMNGNYQLLKGFYGANDIPTVVHTKIDRTLEHQTNVWLDDIIIVTSGKKEEHTGNYIRYSLNKRTKATEQARKNQNYSKKKQYGLDTQYHKTVSDQTKKKRMQQTN